MQVEPVTLPPVSTSQCPLAFLEVFLSPFRVVLEQHFSYVQIHLSDHLFMPKEDFVLYSNSLPFYILAFTLSHMKLNNENTVIANKTTIFMKLSAL